MARPWKKKPIIKDSELLTMKQLVKVGTSFALVIPKEWVRFFATEDEDSKYWVNVEYDGQNTFVIKGDKNA